MKRILIFLIVLILVSTFCATVTSQTNELTFAIDILRHRQELKKVSVDGEKVGFDPEEFDKAFGLGKVEFIIITALPDPKDGILKLAGKDIEIGQGISRAFIPEIQFIPIGEKVKSSEFRFKCFGKEMVCEISFADGINLHAPQSTSINYETFKNVALFGSVLNEKDDLSFCIVSAPKKGIIEVADNKTGSFIYQPMTNFCGKDEFSYKLIDKYGLESEENTITVSINNYDNMYFSDMYMMPEHIAAISMIKDGIMTCGEENGKFDPNGNLSRSEFIAGLVKVCGYEPDIFSDNTYFLDDADIPVNLKPIASAALDNGVFDDTFRDGKRMYSPDECITLSDAETYISNAIINELPEYAVNKALYGQNEDSENIKTTLLTSSGIMTKSDYSEENGNLTRKEAAKMLYGLRMILEADCPMHNFF